MSAGLLSILLFGTLMLLLSTGLPVVFVLGGVSVVFFTWLFGWDATAGLFLAEYKMFSHEVLLALPLFLLMGAVLQNSGIGDAAYGMFHRWMGGLNGGLAMGTVLVCTVFAAMTGVSGAATVAMTLVAVPAMIKRGYDKHLAVGCVAVSGPLGILIPPSVILIIYGLLTHVSVGHLFMGGVFPGLLISLLFITFIGIRCWRNPQLGPALSLEERATWHEKLVSLRAIVLPMIVVFSVLGVIYTGIATPTESAAVGAFMSFICAAIHRRLSWSVFKSTIIQTLKVTGMVFWLTGAAICFGNLYTQIGARDLIETMIVGLQANPWIVQIIMQLSIIILGCFIDDFAMIMILIPIYAPISLMLGFDPVWFGIVLTININIAVVTPPYGFNLFYIRGAISMIRDQIPEDITMGDLYRSVLPFIPLQILGLVIVMVFPQLATWLPGKMF